SPGVGTVPGGGVVCALAKMSDIDSPMANSALPILRAVFIDSRPSAVMAERLSEVHDGGHGGSPQT
ncbi:hypothetical protein, partial [Roseateles saccharophilus]